MRTIERAALLAVLALSACGGDGRPPADAPPTAEEAQSRPAEPGAPPPAEFPPELREPPPGELPVPRSNERPTSTSAVVDSYQECMAQVSRTTDDPDARRTLESGCRLLPGAPRP